MYSLREKAYAPWAHLRSCRKRWNGGIMSSAQLYLKTEVEKILVEKMP